MKRLTAAALLAGILFGVDARASSIGLDFNPWSFSIDGAFPVGKISPDANAEINGGYLRDNDRGGDHLDFGHVGLLATGQVGPQGVHAGVGVRGFLADRGGSHKDGGGAAIGGDLSYRIPQLNERLGILGHFYYAPNILTFGDFHHYLEYGIDVDYQIIRPAFIYVGWRRLELPTSGRVDAAHQGLHVGIEVSF